MSSFSCPQCGGDTTVYDSRATIAKGGAVRRRRRCLTCRHRLTTYEVSADSGGAENFVVQLDALLKQAETIHAQSEALLRDTASLQRLSAAWREIEEGRRGS